MTQKLQSWHAKGTQILNSIISSLNVESKLYHQYCRNSATITTQTNELIRYHTTNLKEISVICVNFDSIARLKSERSSVADWWRYAIVIRYSIILAYNNQHPLYNKLRSIQHILLIFINQMSIHLSGKNVTTEKVLHKLFLAIKLKWKWFEMQIGMQ